MVVLESRLLGSGQTGRSLGDMTSWHTGLFSSLERWTSREQRQQVRRLQFFSCFNKHGVVGVMTLEQMATESMML